MSENTKIELGNLTDWAGQAKRFIEKEVGAEYLGMSVNSTDPGNESPFWHRHNTLEEVYIFLEGEGEIALDDKVLPVKAGTVARAGQNVWIAVRALPTSSTPLKWLCIRAGGDTLETIGNDAELDKERPFPWNA